MKKIVVLTGSFHKNGTSFLMADEFVRGAKKAGNVVDRFDTAHMNIRGCMGCNACKIKEGCICDDDFRFVIEAVMAADVVVFVTPIYYYGMTAQLKAVIDRCHSVSEKLIGKPKQSVLISTCSDTDMNTAKPLHMHYEAIADYLQWENIGEMTALGVPDRASLEKTDYPLMARRFGESI